MAYYEHGTQGLIMNMGYNGYNGNKAQKEL